VFKLAILTTAKLASTNNAIPDDGVSEPKNAEDVLMSILM
jgi:hypothetical protein